MKTLREYIDLISESTTVDDEVQGAFNTFKKPAEEKYEIAPGTVDTHSSI
jgi:hypothetical protein